MADAKLIDGSVTDTAEHQGESLIDPKKSSEELSTKESKARSRRRERLHGVHCYIAKTGLSAVAASAAVLGLRSTEEIALEATSSAAAGARSSIFALYLGSVSWASEAAAAARAALLALAESIGRPPRQPLQDPDPPAVLLWTIDLLIIFLLASAVLFVLAFAAGAPAEAADYMTKDTRGFDALKPSAPERGPSFSGRAKMLLLVVGSVLAGGLLNVKHIMWSALKCGI